MGECQVSGSDLLESSGSRLGAYFAKVRIDRADIKVSQATLPPLRLGIEGSGFVLRGHRPTFLCLSLIFTAGDVASP